MLSLYILEGKIPKPIDDVKKWGRWFEKADRSVNRTELSNGISISTVFLGLDHSFGSDTPLLFKTMVFGQCRFENYQERYSTYSEAEIGHIRIVEMVKAIEDRLLTDTKIIALVKVIPTESELALARIARREQDKISFKMGIKEAVKAVMDIGLDRVSIRDNMLEKKAEEWQAKLEDWGYKMEQEDLGERIENAIREWRYGARIVSSLASVVFALIKEAGYVRLSNDQSLPQYAMFCCSCSEKSMPKAQQDMIKAGWRKVIMEE